MSTTVSLRCAALTALLASLVACEITGSGEPTAPRPVAAPRVARMESDRAASELAQAARAYDAELRLAELGMTGAADASIRRAIAALAEAIARAPGAQSDAYVATFVARARTAVAAGQLASPPTAADILPELDLAVAAFQSLAQRSYEGAPFVGDAADAFAVDVRELHERTELRVDRAGVMRALEQARVVLDLMRRASVNALSREPR